jgi:hypothetical protein
MSQRYRQSYSALVERQRIPISLNRGASPCLLQYSIAQGRASFSVLALTTDTERPPGTTRIKLELLKGLSLGAHAQSAPVITVMRSACCQAHIAATAKLGNRDVTYSVASMTKMLGFDDHGFISVSIFAEPDTCFVVTMSLSVSSIWLCRCQGYVAFA